MRSNRGFTLSEILVSLVVVSVGMAALCTLALLGFNEFLYTKNKLEAQSEAMRFQYLMTAYFSQAVNVRVDPAAPNPPTNGVIGEVRDVNFTDVSPPAATAPQLIATFLRDVGGRGTIANVNNVAGDYRETAIWWKRPETGALNSQRTSGVVFFDGDPGGTSPALNPSYDDQYVGRMTELQLTQEVGGSGNNRVSAVRVRAVFRYMRPGTGINWCPEAQIVGGTANCAINGTVYRDYETSFRVVLRNNVVDDVSVTGNPVPDRPLGLIYFFNPVIPAQWRN